MLDCCNSSSNVALFRYSNVSGKNTSLLSSFLNEKAKATNVFLTLILQKLTKSSLFALMTSRFPPREEKIEGIKCIGRFSFLANFSSSIIASLGDTPNRFFGMYGILSLSLYVFLSSIMDR